MNRLAPDEAPGANLGWSVMEGAHCFGSSDCETTGLVLPLAEYPTGEQGCAITGGYVYRGTAVDGLFGWYLFSDYCSGLLFGIPSNLQPPPGAAERPEVLLQTGLAVASLGADADGELYLADAEGGALYRIVRAS